VLFRHASGFHLKAYDIVLALDPRSLGGGDLQLVAAGGVPEVQFWTIRVSPGAVTTFRA
jgi:molybdopterin biosynthesis enzyme